MRVCHVIESAGTGAGQVVIDLSHFMVGRGDAVTVICGMRRAETHFINSLTNMPGVTLVFTSMRRAIGLHDAIDAWRLLRELRARGPFDVIHGHSSKAGALVRLVGVFFPRSLKLYTPHGFITMSPRSPKIYRWIERALSYFCSAVIAVSWGEGEHAKSLGIPASKVKVIPNGTSVDTLLPRDKAREELGFAPHETVLGFVGRFEDQKNPLLAIDAFAMAHKAHPSLKFAMIGEGSLLAGVKESIDKHDLKDNVILLGYRNGRQLMTAFDALVNSSDFETLPISFIEALTGGVPIVTRHVGGVEEAIIEGETGFLAQGPGAEDLARAMMAFAQTTADQRRSMNEKTRAHSRHFTRERMASDVCRFYAEKLAGASMPIACKA